MVSVLLLVLPIPSADGAEAWEAMEPDAFGKLKKLQKPIERDSFDAELLEAAVFHETNRVRADHDLPALRADAAAASAARRHSKWMLYHGRLSHLGKESDDGKRSSPMDRVQAVGISPSTVAENVAFSFRLEYESGRQVYVRQRGGRKVFSYKPDGRALPARTYGSFAKSVVQQLMNSPEHRENILLKDINHAGMGSALEKTGDGMDRIFVTQKFFTPFPVGEGDGLVRSAAQ